MRDILKLVRNRIDDVIASRRYQRSFPYLLFFAVCLVVWIPEGFNIGPANDGWRNLDASPQAMELGLRFFGKIPRTIGLYLVPTGFQGWQWMLLVVTAIRGGLFFAIVRRLFPGEYGFAIACGLLALFHPADHVYFWVDSIGVDFTFDIALAACLASLAYLQIGARQSLLWFWLLQLGSIFGYAAFLPLIFAFTIGIGALWRTQGHRVRPAYFWAVVLPPLIGVGIYLVLSVKDLYREGSLFDANWQRIAAGYFYELKVLVPNFLRVFASPGSGTAWGLAVLPAVLAFATVSRSLPKQGSPAEPRAGTSPAPRSWKFYALCFVGLLLLAAVSYAPYAISKAVRFGTQRQMLAAGAFIYTLVIAPIFLFVLARCKSKFPEGVVVAAIALFITANGIENRSEWANVYRNSERFMAALAAEVTDLAPHSTLIVELEDREQAKRVAGLFNRNMNFEHALQYMYGDPTLKGGFLAFDDNPVHFGPSSLDVEVQAFDRRTMVLHSDYSHVVFVGYKADSGAVILRQNWLSLRLRPESRIFAYKPYRLVGAAPGKDSRVCTMFEEAYEPPVCSSAEQIYDPKTHEYYWKYPYRN